MLIFPVVVDAIDLRRTSFLKLVFVSCRLGRGRYTGMGHSCSFFTVELIELL